jgi:HEAT repeat protein
MDEESDTIDSLIASLELSDKKALRAAVDALIPRASSDPEVAVRLRAVLDTAPAKKRWPVAYVLAQIAPLSAPCLDALKDALDENDPDIRWAVALLLVQLGKKSETGVARRLIELVHSGKPTQKRMAVYCLRDIGAEDPAHHRAVQHALGDSDPLVRVAAVTSLKAFPMIGESATDRLLQLVSSDADSRVQSSAALALAHLGPATEKVSRALNDAARSSDTKLAKAARAALEIMNKKTIPDLK